MDDTWKRVKFCTNYFIDNFDAYLIVLAVNITEIEVIIYTFIFIIFIFITKQNFTKTISTQLWHDTLYNCITLWSTTWKQWRSTLDPVSSLRQQPVKFEDLFVNRVYDVWNQVFCHYGNKYFISCSLRFRLYACICTWKYKIKLNWIHFFSTPSCNFNAPVKLNVFTRVKIYYIYKEE